MHEHTPGPWRTEWEFCDCGGDYPCGHKPYPYRLIAPSKQVMRYVDSPFERMESACLANFTEAEDVTPADIALLEAAPDLISAALFTEDVLSAFLEDGYSKNELTKALAVLRDAIEKAELEASDAAAH